ncbi:MAG: dependent oxidoreductase family protein [Burkholderiales bacterium]|jgi:hypothetical protein|nr:dependent oxidoreductase family protein [Burkholderiales bacterium]
METYDITVIGSGIQGMILMYQLKKLNKEIKILNISNPLQLDGQTSKSQFYIHRGHFYQNANLTAKLNNTFENWLNIIKDLDLTTVENASFIGFRDKCDPWLDNWNSANIPFVKVDTANLMGYHTTLKSVFTFPHQLINGAELMNKLHTHLSQPNQLLDHIELILPVSDGYEIFLKSGKKVKSKKISICAGNGTEEVLNHIEGVEKQIEIQNRFCQVLVLKGKLPNLSLLVPDQKFFIAPQSDYPNNIQWLCTYDEDPVIVKSEVESNIKQESINLKRLTKQFQKLQIIFPTLYHQIDKMQIYTAKKTESKSLGNGHRPNDVFVENLNNDITVCLPTKLTLAFEAASNIISKLNLH